MKKLLSMITICLPLMAEAEFRLTSGTTTIDVLDGSALDSCPYTNCIAYTGSLNGWSVTMTTPLPVAVDPVDGSPLVFEINSVAATSAEIDPITLEFSEDNMIFNQPEMLLVVRGAMSSNTFTSTANFNLWTGAARFDERHLIGCSPTATGCPLGLTFNTSPFSGTSIGPVTPSDTSLTIRAFIDLGDGADGSASFDAAAVKAPEPVSIMLLGSGLIILGAVRWRDCRYKSSIRRSRPGSLDL
jgi:hypothetical protein